MKIHKSKGKCICCRETICGEYVIRMDRGFYSQTDWRMVDCRRCLKSKPGPKQRKSG
jgi:hypothetical protein